jgi:hypothetical protein
MSAVLAVFKDVFWPLPGEARDISQDFWVGFAGAWVFCGSVGALSVKFAGKVFGSAFAELDENKKVLWHVYSYCLLCGVISNGLLAGDMPTLFYHKALAPDFLMNGAYGARFEVATGFSVGFLAFDLAVMFCWWKRLMAAYKRPLFLQMLFHHGASIFCWPQCIWRSKGHGFVSYCILTESTSLFLNVNWLLRESKLGGERLYLANGVLLFLSFLLVRILTIPWAMWAFCVCPKTRWSWFETIASFMFAPLVPMLNMFWFYLIAKGVGQKLGLCRSRNGHATKSE